MQMVKTVHENLFVNAARIEVTLISPAAGGLFDVSVSLRGDRNVKLAQNLSEADALALAANPTGA